MRRIARIMLLLLAFAIPWEYSLNLGEPLGNAARIASLLLLLAAVLAMLQAGRMRTPGVFCWIALGLFLWFCCTCFWTIDAAASLEKLRAYFQEMMIVWLVWEFVDTADDLRNLLRAMVAGSCVLALLTLAVVRSPEAIAAGQIRFAAYGQDPNDIARFLDIGFPLAALWRWHFCRSAALRSCSRPRAVDFWPPLWPSPAPCFFLRTVARDGSPPWPTRCRFFLPLSGSLSPVRPSNAWPLFQSNCRAAI
jgi:hypothetical protein